MLCRVPELSGLMVERHRVGAVIVHLKDALGGAAYSAPEATAEHTWNLLLDRREAFVFARELIYARGETNSTFYLYRPSDVVFWTAAVEKIVLVTLARFPQALKNLGNTRGIA